MKLCDLETAKALQELGYDGEYQTTHYLDKNLKEKVPAPRLDDAAYFLRDKFKVSAFVGYNHYDMYGAFVVDSSDRTRGFRHFSTYEDALECAVKKAIEIIKGRQNNE